MGLFDLFRRSNADKISYHIRACFDNLVKDTLRETNGDPILGGIMVHSAIYSLYQELKETPDLRCAYQIIEEEKDRALRKYLR